MTIAQKSAVYLLCLLVLFFRLPESFLDPEIVHSDARMFIGDALRYGLAAFLIPLTGYISVLPRVIADLMAGFPRYEGVIFSYSAYLVWTLVISILLQERTKLRLKPILCLATVLIPAKAYWVHGNAINSIWILALLFPLLLLRAEAKTTAQRCTDLGLLGFTALSTAHVLWLWPFFLVKYWRERNRYARDLACVAILCALLQGVFWITSYQPRVLTSSHTVDFVAWQQVLLSFAGGPIINWPLDTTVTAVLLPVLLLAHCVLFFVAWRTRRYDVLTLMLVAWLSILPALISFSNSPRTLHWHLDRYKYLPAVLFVWSVAQCYPNSRSYPNSRRSSVLVIAILALAGVCSLQTVRRGVAQMQRKDCTPEIEEQIGPCAGPLEFRWYHE